MTRGKKKPYLRAITILISAAMLAQGAGCASPSDGGAETESVSVQSGEESDGAQSAESIAASEAESASPEPTEAPAQKEYVWDFDALVNDGWREKAKEKIGEDLYYSRSDEVFEMISERVLKIMDETDLQSLPEDSDLYKAIYVYRQLQDSEWREKEASSAIKKKLDRIDGVKNLNDLYDLFGDEFYNKYNWGSSRSVEICEGGSGNVIKPLSMLDGKPMTEEQKEVTSAYLQRIGYSKKRAEEILKNFAQMDEFISDFNENVQENGSWYTIWEEQLQQENVQYPILDILRNAGALGDYEFIFAQLDFYRFMKEYYVPENAKKIRDHALTIAAIDLSRFDDPAQPRPTDVFEKAKYRDTMTSALETLAEDMLVKEYRKIYFDDDFVQRTDQMLEDIRTAMREVIHDSDWLTTHGKELARRKVLRLNYFVGENGYCDDFSEVTLTDDPLDNYIALRTSLIRFRNSQLSIYYDDRKVYNVDMFVPNAYYVSQLNAIVISCGQMARVLIDGEATYEEELASLGNVIAHEISHAYDPNGSQYDEYGYTDPWMKDEEYKKYSERVAKIESFFDGMEVGEGCVINGKQICSETFADLMAMECCLRILAKRENADYDVFFKAYAERRASYYKQEALEYLVEKDTHLTDKERVNYILGQFDKFYEIYDVDPESPYYVPEENRLPAF